MHAPVGFDACSQIVDQLKVGQTTRQHFEDVRRDLVLIDAQNLRSFAFIKGLGRPLLTLQQPLQTSHGHSIHKVLVVLQGANAIDHGFFCQGQSTKVVKAQDVIDLAIVIGHAIQQLANTILVLLLLLTCHEVLKVLVHVLLPACSKTQQVVIALTNLFIQSDSRIGTSGLGKGGGIGQSITNELHCIGHTQQARHVLGVHTIRRPETVRHVITIDQAGENLSQRLLALIDLSNFSCILQRRDDVFIYLSVRSGKL